jgi:zinc transport system substrate-binding protein
MAAIAKADIFAYTGADMEPWAEKVIEAMKDSGTARAVDLSAGMHFLRSSELAENEGEEHPGKEEHDEDEHEEHDAHEKEDEHDKHGHAHVLDPHVWLDPVLALAMTDTLLAAMCEVDPDNAAYYTANAAPLRDELRAIDADCREMVAGAKRRTLVFGGRFAFAYFAERYGLEHIGAYDSCGAGAEPSVRRVMEITEYVEKNAVPVIFHEEATEPRISMGIADATGCKTMVAHSLHNLSAEELESGITFVELMRRNVAALAEGLQ